MLDVVDGGAGDPDEPRELAVTIRAKGLRNVPAYLTSRVVNPGP